jgi:nicotinate-nucleotide adenylyltransferase
VRLLVAGDPWMKADSSPAHIRVQLAEAAVAHDPNLRVDDREVRRDGPTFTADTLEELVREEPDTRWFFLIGADAASAFDRWQRAEAAFALATFVVVPRPGHDAGVPAPYGDRVEQLAVPTVDLSSSDLRERYRSGRATRYLVPDAVDTLVRAGSVYGGQDG